MPSVRPLQGTRNWRGDDGGKVVHAQDQRTAPARGGRAVGAGAQPKPEGQPEHGAALPSAGRGGWTHVATARRTRRRRDRGAVVPAAAAARSATAAPELEGHRPGAAPQRRDAATSVGGIPGGAR